MELRHLRCFLAVAEELHFARAAERLHIEQSPLSRAIKELEEDLGTQLFVRTTRSTRLTRAGELFLEHVPRVLTALQQARDSVKAAANGFHSQLRFALSDGVPPSRFSSFLALCREEEPDIELRLSEVSLEQLLKGLHDDLYDLGFAQSDEVGSGIIAEAVWREPLMVAVPARHPLLTYKRIPLEEVLRYPLVLGDPRGCEGYARHIEQLLRRVDQEPLIAERVASVDLMMALVAAGFALALVGTTQIATSREPGVVARPLAGRTPMLTTYLLRMDREPSEILARFIERINNLGSSAAYNPGVPSEFTTSEEVKP
ncbi:LysR family transcriptional regulator [Dickeya dianthicola]|uniref:LysR family transcriptional regulator n=1 Tax=Dickeya dianthicola TaxID=204039 RepID=A0AAX1C0J7_9GAMM|nr:LysR family transcriptional regulator [Dickeya dianthicola]MCI4004598.1 LysR family transcriptional regulator [Dickeya dianthicola]PWD68488.1 LysR family transcriptional regulator [Dickeya dianthicola]